MSEPNEPPARPRTRRITALALLAGVTAGALGVYVIETRSGNEMAGGACPADRSFAALVDENARGDVAAMAPLERPFAVADLGFRDRDGAETSLAAFGGRTVLVNLWATWCPPCLAEMPALDALERERGGERFAVVPISVDMGEIEKPAAFYQEIGLSDLPLYHDGTMQLFNDLKREGVAFGLPVTILVDEAGCARAAMNGPAEWSGFDALRLVDALTSPAAGS